MLSGKTILLGVTGSIAAYKGAALASALKKTGADVHVLMTENATRFVSPVTFETLTGNKCPVDTFDRNFEYSVEHVSLAKRADLCIIAPATADVIAKLAHGLADDMLTTTVLACRCKKLVAPAMNTGMYENPATQENLAALKRYGYEVMEPATGLLACGDIGPGKMPEPETILSHVLQDLSCKKDMAGLHVLVTAGPTQEAVDPVRFLTNHSSGKMGYAVARAAARRGAEVTLVSGPTCLNPPEFVRFVPAVSAEDMFEAVKTRAEGQNLIVMAAAVADYRPREEQPEKMKKSGDMVLPLTRTVDILQYLGNHRRPGQLLCGFSMETENLIENSRAKLQKKQVDLIAANSLRVKGAGFGCDTNAVTLITEKGEEELPLLTKEETAMRLLDRLLGLLTAKGHP